MPAPQAALCPCILKSAQSADEPHPQFVVEDYEFTGHPAILEKN
jgi:hypothetical protein